MKKLTIVLLLLYTAAHAQGGLTTILPTNEKVPYFTSDQFITAPAGFLTGSVVSTAVEDWTDSKALGILAGTITAVGIGYAKDKWDHKNNTTFINTIPPYNDTIASGAGGFLGSVTVRIPLFTGKRTYYKKGYNNRWFKRKRR